MIVKYAKLSPKLTQLYWHVSSCYGDVTRVAMVMITIRQFVYTHGQSLRTPGTRISRFSAHYRRTCAAIFTISTWLALHGGEEGRGG